MSELTVAEKNDRLWGMLCHLSALVGFLGVPFGNILGPLVVWLIKRNDSTVIDEAGKEALNAQIAATVYCMGAGLLCLILIGFPILFGIIIVDLVFIIQASLKVNNGEKYSYKFIFRLIK